MTKAKWHRSTQAQQQSLLTLPLNGVVQKFYASGAPGAPLTCHEGSASSSLPPLELQRPMSSESSRSQAAELPAVVCLAGPTVTPYEKESNLTTIQIAADPGRRDKAVKSSYAVVHARTNMGPRAAMALLPIAAAAFGADGVPMLPQQIRLNQELLETVADAMKVAQYRSVAEYISMTKQVHTAAYSEIGAEHATFPLPVSKSDFAAVGISRSLAFTCLW
jgi:hypothetical protein